MGKADTILSACACAVLLFVAKAAAAEQIFLHCTGGGGYVVLRVDTARSTLTEVDWNGMAREWVPPSQRVTAGEIEYDAPMPDARNLFHLHKHIDRMTGQYVITAINPPPGLAIDMVSYGTCEKIAGPKF